MSNTKVCTKCSLEKPLDAFNKDKYKKDGYMHHCKECKKEYYNKNREAIAKQRVGYRQKNRERLVAQTKEWCKNNKERHYVTSREWKKNNRDKCTAHSAKRRAAKLNATPAWANQEKIDYVYYCRDLVNKVYGGDCEVDHIAPLQGKHVCGLHVHNNLQLLSAKANRSKGARRTE